MKHLQMLVIIGSLIFLGYMAYAYQEEIGQFFFGDPTVAVELGGVKLLSRVADNDMERAQGLSGTTAIGDFQAMLFIFPEPGRHGIWMKDMNYPIDIFWANEDRMVIHVEERVSPDSYPRSFRPPKDALYVIETKAGLAEAFDVKVGDRVEIPWNIVSKTLSD